MGSMSQIIGMMPGMNSNALKQLNMDDRQVGWTEAIINSMTPSERQQPEIINGSRIADLKRKWTFGTGNKRPFESIFSDEENDEKNGKNEKHEITRIGWFRKI